MLCTSVLARCGSFAATNAEEQYQAACLHALLHASKDNDGKGTEHSKEAIALLVKARDGGYFNQRAARHALRTDPDLDSIRAEEEFRKLVSGLPKP